MKLSNPSTVPVYTIAGEGTARPLPEWLARKRKRSLKTDSEYANRVELLQDFEFEEASQCVRVSRDGEWVMSTGTYKPQIHAHYLPHLSLSYARHTNTVNQTFVLLGDDYSKSLHLQTDRVLEFHTAGGLHHTTRVPRYGRDLKYNRRTAEALVPSVGVNVNGNGEVFRLNLELGRFMKGFEVDVGGDDLESMGAGALQGGIRAGAVNCAAVAEDSHGLLAFGTSLGTVEFWDTRSRTRVSALGPPAASVDAVQDGRPEITALDFDESGLHLATGTDNGVIHTYDLRSPVPLLRKEQGYDSPIQTLKYLNPTSSRVTPGKLLSSDRRSIKLYDATSGNLWTRVEPAVDLNCVEWVPDSGMLLTANEGRQQHALFIPSLGPSPSWCSFLDNLVEEMAMDVDDPNAFTPSSMARAGEVYDNFKFLDMKQLKTLSLDHLTETVGLLRPYMHGYFVPQRLYEQARLLTTPDLAWEQQQKTIQDKINQERESRIRGSKQVAVKVNRKLAEKLAAREEANEKRKAQRLLKQRGSEYDPPVEVEGTRTLPHDREISKQPPKSTTDLMADNRFKGLFEDEDFEIDETSREYQLHNPSSLQDTRNSLSRKQGLTAVEQEALDEDKSTSGEDGSDHEDDAIQRQRQRRTDGQPDVNDGGRIGSASYKRTGHKARSQQNLKMQVSSTKARAVHEQRQRQNKTFGDLAAGLPSVAKGHNVKNSINDAVGAKQISFAPTKISKKMQSEKGPARALERSSNRRSASGNVFRRL